MSSPLASPQRISSIREIPFHPGIPIGFIVLLAAILYFFQLDAKSLWIDELISIADAQNVAFPPTFSKGRLLYYILLRGWMLLGHHDAWLRSLSVLFALGSVILIYHLGCRLFRPATGLIAALLFALSPTIINHAQEVRYYTLSLFLGLAGSLLLVRAIDRPGTIQPLLGWSIFRILAIVTTPINAALAIADGAIVGWHFRHNGRAIGRFLGGAIAIALGSLPSLYSILNSRGSHWVEASTPGLSHVLREIRFLTAYPFPPTPPYQTLFFQGFILVLWGLIAIALWLRPPEPRIAWVSIWAFVPLGAIFMLSQGSRSFWVTRYLLLVSPYLFLSIAIALEKLWQRWRILALGVLLVYAIALSLGLHAYYTRSDRYIGVTGNYRDLIQTISNREQPGDRILWISSHTRPQLTLNHYYSGKASINYQQPLPRDRLNETALRAWIAQLPFSPSRTWLVYPNNRITPEFSTLLENQFQVQFHRDFRNAHLWLLAPRSLPQN
ncbi:glycosyltransferase family 39 protein [Desertifilum sp. FACHB-1129]|uniref:glycosyltransferase family 39 protein n=1 Tax=Desertifilum TaxID=1185872 RepID=UPI0009F3DEC0|nr:MULTISPECIES: glycosyltransferase family 39 protein [Desertifilum]MBD2315161.1 glycosyltransferase family 39 protein [Desertifilum sp. FACHB-1129]MBD2320886.1 glycosyltransferase family 39 protein [Desertifilum sp. FACHB-866]MBD2331014.1 glycosyltransferase family 39 protein [Desertifilum sp. FACHB-868]MDA0209658.1 glycosyltransferase family 39 protein [Cyanobacteria bacterium FC1]